MPCPDILTPESKSSQQVLGQAHTVSQFQWPFLVEILTSSTFLVAAEASFDESTSVFSLPAHWQDPTLWKKHSSPARHKQVSGQITLAASTRESEAAVLSAEENTLG